MPTAITFTRTQLRKLVGKGKFTVHDLAAKADVSTDGARAALARLVAEGDVQALDETRKHTDDDGNPTRGRPSALYRVTSGK